LEGYRSTKWATSAYWLADLSISWLANDKTLSGYKELLQSANLHIGAY
jgi:hypothetical protein